MFIIFFFFISSARVWVKQNCSLVDVLDCNSLFEKNKIRQNYLLNAKDMFKNIEIETVFTKTETNYEETSIFIKRISFALNTLIPVSFPLVNAPLKLLFSYGIKLYHCISFYVLYILRSYSWDAFSSIRSCTELDLVSMESAALAQSSVSPKSFCSKSLNLLYDFS